MQGAEVPDGRSWCEFGVEVQKRVSGVEKNCQDYIVRVSTP